MIGVLPNQEIEKLIKIGAISSDVPIESEQIQPASLDMRLGSKAFRIRASFFARKSRKG
jgi:dCTP deaminase